MGNEHIIGLRLTADNKESIAAIKQVRDEQERLGQSTRALNSEAGKMASQYGMTAQALNGQSVAVVEVSKDVQRLLDRYDPLGTKLRSLESDFARLNSAASKGLIGKQNDTAVDKTYSALNAEISKTKDLMMQAGVATDEHGKSLSGLGLNSQYARRELMQLGSEAINGNFSRMPQTFSSLVSHSNLLSAAMSPIGLAVAGVTAVVVIGVVAWEHWGNEVEKANIKALNSLEKTSKEAEKLREATRTPEESLSEIERKIANNQWKIEENKKASRLKENQQTKAVGAWGVFTGSHESATPSAAQSMLKENKQLMDSNEALARQAETLRVRIEAPGIALKEAYDRAMEAERKFEQQRSDNAEKFISSIEQEIDKLGASWFQLKRINNEQSIKDKKLTDSEAIRARAAVEEEIQKQSMKNAFDLQEKNDAEIIALEKKTAQEIEKNKRDTEAHAHARKLNDINNEENARKAASDSAKKGVASTLSNATTSAFFADNGRSFTDNFANSLKSTLEPAFNKLIAQLIVNAFTTEKTAEQTATTNSDWIMAIVALIATQFGNQASSKGKSTTITGSLTEATGGTKNEYMQMDSQWFEAQKNWTLQTKLSKAELNSYTAAIVESRQVMIVAGDALGYAGTSAKSMAINLTIAGDVEKGLSQSIGSSLLPALVLFQREGESLNETAKRLTDTFKGTNNLLSAIGVSSDKAFGGFGLQSAAARQSIIDASGGLSEFNTNSKGFIDNFLTPAQQLAPALDDVGRMFNKLGIEGVTTNEQFAALVKTQLELGNTTVVAQLLSVSDSFNSITKSAGDANKQINALLNKDMFATLVDYTRAMSQNGAGSIAGAQLSTASLAAKEQVGTATYTAKNAAAIAAANAAQTSVKTNETTTGVSKFNEMWSAFMQMIDHAVGVFVEQENHMQMMILDTLSHWLVSLGDTLGHWIGSLWDTLTSWVGKIVDAIKGITGGITGGGGDSSINPLDPAGIFSDPRLKENVRQVGTTTLGLGQYDFSYIGDPRHTMYRGVMADEVKRVMPSAVSHDASGYDKVNYSMLGLRMQKLSSFDVGTNYLPHDMIAQVHAGEEITPRPYVDMQRAARDETNRLLARLQQEVSLLRKENQAGQVAIAASSQKTSKTLERWNGEGMPAVRV